MTIGQLQADDHSFFFFQDADGSVPFFWGTDSEGHLVLSEDAEIIKKGCGNSFAPFPKGIEQRNCGAPVHSKCPQCTCITHFFVLLLQAASSLPLEDCRVLSILSMK